MQRQHKDGKRPRISVSLDPADYDWVQEFEGPSDSYKVSRIIRAARLAGITIDEAMSAGALEDFRDWLVQKKRKSKLESELAAILSDYLQQ